MFWRNFLKEAGISSEYCVIYEDIFEKNRIDKDQLLDLSKEYLNAMSIEAVGDVIKILKYSRIVCERQRISNLSKTSESEKSVKEAKSTVVSTTVVQKPVRRVLPEHEGRYKVKMPTGTTAKSRAIIAKMQSDKLEKKSIFDRLTSPNSSSEISSTSPDIILKKKSPPTHKKSIFNRLGTYKELDVETKSKTSWPTGPKGIVKPSPSQRTFPKKVIQVKQAKTLKTKDEVESEKQVTFSPEVTLRMYEPIYEPQSKSPKKSFGSVKSRLGSSGTGNLGIVKTPMKNISTLRPSKMKSDMMRKESIHSRLTVDKKSVFKRLGD